jgi:SEC-C motif domain protein
LRWGAHARAARAAAPQTPRSLLKKANRHQAASSASSVLRPCPCHSGLAYEACCAPYHRGEREAAEPAALMRSRYAAFALGEAEYLWRTLHEDHPDRAEPREAMLRSFREAKNRLRYTGLAILEERRAGREGEVLFCARLSERGQDRSFVELSDFAHDGVGWRYLSGVLVPLGALGRPVEGLTVEAFLALAG